MKWSVVCIKCKYDSETFSCFSEEPFVLGPCINGFLFFVHSFVCLFISLFVGLFFRLSVYLLIYLLVCSSVCLFIYKSICWFVLPLVRGCLLLCGLLNLRSSMLIAKPKERRNYFSLNIMIGVFQGTINRMTEGVWNSANLLWSTEILLV